MTAEHYEILALVQATPHDSWVEMMNDARAECDYAGIDPKGVLAILEDCRQCDTVR